MAGPALDVLTPALTAWAAAVRRRPRTVAAAFAGLTLLAGIYAAGHLDIDTDTSAMLSPELPWRQTEIAYAQAFPGQEHGIVAMIDGATPEQAEAAVQALRQALLQRSELTGVTTPGSGDFFDRSGFLFLEPRQLEALASSLEQAQPFFGRLAAEPSLSGYLDLLTEMLTQKDQALPIDIARVLDPVAATLQGQMTGKPVVLSWQSLVAANTLPPQTRRFVLAHARDAEHEPTGLAAMREVVTQLHLDPAHGVRVRLTGEVPLWMDELAAAANGAVVSALAALLLGVGFLYWGLRSVRLVLASLAALISGLVLTAGLAAATVGKLNLISVAFSTLYIGIAIDYGVQLCMRYRELRGHGVAHDGALVETGGRFGAALVLCALTTLAGFLSFTPTSYRGVAELGEIAGSGILIGLFTSLTLLPALIEWWPPRADLPAPTVAIPAVIVRLASLPLRHRRAVQGTAVALALLSLALLPLLRFDYNPMHLKPLHTESLEAYEDLVNGADSPLTLSVLVPSAAQAQALAGKLEKLPSVARALSLASFVPGRQDEKLATLESLQLTIGLSLPETLELKPVDASRDLAALGRARDAARAFHGNASAQAACGRLADALDAWLAALDSDPVDNLVGLRDAMLGALPALLGRLHRALNVPAITLDTLPAELRRDWVTRDGRFRVEISPRQNLNDDAALLAFVAEVQGVAPEATGAPVDYVEGARAVVGAFEQAFLCALVMIVLILLALLRDVRDTLRAMAPLALGSLVTMALLALLHQSVNFANIIALPLLLGVGVDIGVLILWRARHGAADEDNPVLTGTGAAVLVSVLATLASFASLMLSVHRGMASLGLLLTLGLLVYLACAFLVLPALLPTRSGAEKTAQ